MTTNGYPLKKITRHYEQGVSERVDFNLLDRKGRKIGYRWTITPITVSETETGSGYCIAPEVANAAAPVTLSFNVTRNGQNFGAGNSSKFMVDAASAETVAKTAAEAARKRYASKSQMLR